MCRQRLFTEEPQRLRLQAVEEEDYYFMDMITASRQEPMGVTACNQQQEKNDPE